MVLHHLQFIFVYVGKRKANFVFTMCAICNTLTIRGQFWKNLIIRDDIMNIMKNAVKMRYQNSPGMWRKHTPSALDKWYDKLESDCDIQFVVFLFCWPTYFRTGTHWPIYDGSHHICRVDDGQFYFILVWKNERKKAS